MCNQNGGVCCSCSQQACVGLFLMGMPLHSVKLGWTIYRHLQMQALSRSSLISLRLASSNSGMALLASSEIAAVQLDAPGF